MRITTLLAAAILAPASPLLAQSLCRLAPLDPVAGIHTGGLDAEGDWVVARVTNQSQEWLEVRRKFGPRWLPAVTIPSPDLPGSDFGRAVDVDVSLFGVEVMATSIGSSTPQGAGVVHRYLYNGGIWAPVPEFRSSDPDAQSFGTNMARGGNLAAVQSKRFLFASTESQVHLFEPLGAISWVETGRIDHPDPNGDRTYFGDALAVDRLPTGVLIAASSREQSGGRAWAWRSSLNGQVGPAVELVPSTPPSSAFGSELAIWNGHIAVSDPDAEGIPGQPGSGVVTLFAPSALGNQFIEIARFVAPTPTAIGFGRGLDFDADRLAVTFIVPGTQPGLFSDFDALTIIEDLPAAMPRYRTTVSVHNDVDTAVGRGVALGAGEAVTTDVVTVVGNMLRLDPSLRRFAVLDPVLDVCPGAPNSTGSPARLAVDGCVSSTSVSLLGESLPPSTLGIPLVGTLRGALPVGSGTLCIGDPQRLAVAAADAQGVMRATIDPSALGFVVGDVLIAQLWFRDGAPGSNLSGAVTFELAP